MRDNLDRYYTPDIVAEQCIAAIRSQLPTKVRAIEPAVGTGSFARALRKKIPSAQLETNDLDLQVEADYHVDFTKVSQYKNDFNLIFGNPPFSQAMEFIQKALLLLPEGGSCAFLLRLGFLASVKRRSFFDETPPHRVYVLSKRPSFSCDGKTDGCEYAFLLWKKGTKMKPLVEWI